LEYAREPKSLSDDSNDVYYLKTQVDMKSRPIVRYDTRMKMFITKQKVIVRSGLRFYITSLLLQIFTLIHEFNSSLIDLRREKLAVFNKCKARCERLKEIKRELPSELIKTLPYEIIDLDYEKEFPDNNLEVSYWICLDWFVFSSFWIILD
jgi:hypothetical protein